MGLMRKQILMRQREHFEQVLRDRLSLLSERGIKPPIADKDPLARKTKADIKAVNYRLRMIAENEKRAGEIAKIKAEKAAAPKEQQGAKLEKPKKTPGGSKEKKPKPEKQAAPPKEKEEGKSRKSTEAPE